MAYSASARGRHFTACSECDFPLPNTGKQGAQRLAMLMLETLHSAWAQEPHSRLMAAVQR